MPIFEYYCNHCQKDFEKLVSKSTEVKCPECGEKNVSKKLSSFSFSQSSNSQASCQGGCNEGYEKGCCGSGLCPGH